MKCRRVPSLQKRRQPNLSSDPFLQLDLLQAIEGLNKRAQLMLKLQRSTRTSWEESGDSFLLSRLTPAQMQGRPRAASPQMHLIIFAGSCFIKLYINFISSKSWDLDASHSYQHANYGRVDFWLFISIFISGSFYRFTIIVNDDSIFPFQIFGASMSPCYLFH